MKRMELGPVAEVYRSSLSERLNELDNRGVKVKSLVLKNLSETPLYRLMKSVHHGEGQDSFDVGGYMEQHIFLEDGGTKELQMFSEGAEDWDVYRKTLRPEQAKESAIKTSNKVKGLVNENKIKLVSERIEPQAELSRAEKELALLEGSEEAELVGVLERIGYISSHLKPQQKIKLLEKYINDLPIDLSNRVRDAIGNKAPDSFFKELLGSWISNCSKDELRLLNELDAVSSAFINGRDQLTKIRESAKQQLADIESKYTIDEKEAFFDLYAQELVDRILKEISGSSVEKASQIARAIEIIKGQGRLAKKIIYGGSILANLNTELKRVEEIIEKDKGEVKGDSGELIEIINRISAIDTEIEEIKIKKVETANDVSLKIESIKSLESEKKQLEEKLKKLRGSLPYHYGNVSRGISREASIKAIIKDKDSVTELSANYDSLSRDVFGVSVEQLVLIEGANAKIIELLKQKVVEQVNNVVAENTRQLDSDIENGAYEGRGRYKINDPSYSPSHSLEKEREYLKLGGTTASLEMKSHGSMRCCKQDFHESGESHANTAGRFYLDRERGVSIKDSINDRIEKIREIMPNIAWQILAKPVISYDRFAAGYMDGRVWFPIGDADPDMLESALRIYSDKNSFYNSIQSGCDTYSVSVRIYFNVNGSKN